MLTVPDIVLLLLTGAFGGFLSGVLGVGGGIIFIPILDIILKQYGVEVEIVKFILANSLAVIIFTGTFNSYRQYRANNYFPRYVLYTAIPGIVSVLLGSWLIAQGDWYKKEIFNIVFAGLLVPAVLRMFITRKQPEDLKEDIPLKRFSMVGALTGIFTAFSGLGGGLVMIPAFVNVLKLEMKKAISVSAGVVPLFALPTALYYMTSEPRQESLEVAHLGFIMYPIVLPMIIGTLFTVPFGVKTGHRLKPSTSKLIFSIFVVVVLGKMLWESFL